MKKYRIKYEVKGAETAPSLYAEVYAENEDMAKIAFFAKREFYNTIDCEKIVIENIRRIKQ